MISNKAKYALRALLTIAAQHGGETLTSVEISKRHRIPH
ncbi:MAG: transcriptional regulator, partial [Sphingobacteriales bacterium]